MHARQDSFRPSPVRRPPEGLKPLGPGILILLGFGANRSSSETGAPRRRNGPQAKLACWLTPSHRRIRVLFHLCPVSSRVVVPTRRRYPPTVYLQALGKQYRKREYPPVYPERKLFTARTNDPRREFPHCPICLLPYRTDSNGASANASHTTPSPRFLHYTIRFARAIKLSTEGRYAVRVAGLCRALTRSLSPNRL